MPEVLKTAGLSPGKHTEAYADKAARVKEKERKRRSSLKYVRRRFDLKTQCSPAQAIQEVRESTLYQSSCAPPDMEVDDEEIPSAKVPPSYQLLSISSTDNIVVFDVETTGLGKDYQIIQLAA